MIIQSLLDNDLYKFTMMQAVLHMFPGAMVEYRFKCRSKDVDLRPFAEEIQGEVKQLSKLRFQKDELQYLRSFSFFKNDFIDFLRIFQLNHEFIEIKADDEFDIIIRGPWLHTILYEVPILAIVSEVYFRRQQAVYDLTLGRDRLAEKIELIKHKTPAGEFKFTDFGTRRRFSFNWQAEVIDIIRKGLSSNFTGTSNVYLAKQYQLVPHGTMAHEYIQACQALGPRLIDSQKFAFESWAHEYRGALGIALTDTYGLKAFLADFDLYFCKLFDGVRHDSGDPAKWGEKILAHYQAMRINSATKTLVFSDHLDVEAAIKLFWQFKSRCFPVFGIGTNLTHDIGHTPLEIVIKMVECNGQPVAKISDSPEKAVCRDLSYLNYVKQVFSLT